MIPKLRFPEFNDEWKSNYFGIHLQSISSGKSSTLSDGGEYQIYGSTGSIGSSSEYDYEDDHILIARVGANAGSMYRVNGKYKVSDNTLILSLGDDTNTAFTKYFLQRYNLNRLVFGSGQPLITSGQLKKIIVSWPSKIEQQKIADFLTVVDERVGVIKQKIELLKKYKKNVMQQIFSHNVRFKDENGDFYADWEVKKLGELANIKTGNLNAQDAEEDGEYTFFDRSEDIKRYKEYSFDNEALIYAGEGSEFLPRYFNGKYGLHQRAYSISNTDNNINVKFLYYYMITQNNHFLRMAVGSTVKSLRMDCFEKCMIKLPNQNEQQKIADFLTNLDDKINLTEQKLNQARQFKKALLQEMFV
jgi:type I restriction enzyme S subunit